jgi:hypothetical protein
MHDEQDDVESVGFRSADHSPADIPTPFLIRNSILSYAWSDAAAPRVVRERVWFRVAHALRAQALPTRRMYARNAAAFRFSETTKIQFLLDLKHRTRPP